GPPHDPGGGAVQTVRPATRRARPELRGGGRSDLRAARPERRRQDLDHADADRAVPPGRRRGADRRAAGEPGSTGAAPGGRADRRAGSGRRRGWTTRSTWPGWAPRSAAGSAATRWA